MDWIVPARRRAVAWEDPPDPTRRSGAVIMVAPMGRRKGNARCLAALIAAATATGCARTRVETSLAAPVAVGDINAELDFWDAMAERPIVCNDDGLHGLLLFTDGADPSASYAERLAVARQRGWVDDGFDEPGDLAMQRGTIARAIAVHCGIEGGVMMRIVGPHPRYASRELQYLGMMGAGSEQQAISGREFMGVISKAQDYLLLEEARERREAATPEAVPDAPEAAANEPPAATPTPSAPPVPKPGTKGVRP